MNQDKQKKSDKVRLDKWLWAARFYKTRNIAKEAIEGGKVHLNGQRCKPGKEPKVGDELKLRTGWDERVVIVRELSDKRQKAELAQQLYEETAASLESREKAAEQRKAMRGTMAPRPDRRPDKKQRRDILKQKSHLGEP
ncbi:ribosome-associated heat shock protein Hsp15 [Endozoicomonas arenosclerae]|uniref:ribosome-associated heat shock protein Hsp15 n=1 Tax=Endozoicomonas arenosclerae TaxID=1633495 RepID=UPI000782CCF3|nr:ribosome-associated heat shock protein Hsp15 [Endozoicomonas arenosclerae]